MRSNLGLKRNRIHVVEPHVQSLAALVLLTKKLREEELKLWLDFREEFLNARELKCHYCGKDNLQIEVDMTDKEQLKYLATIDHVIPLSKGGKMFDPNNCVVACFNCNRKKGNHENFNLGRQP